MIINIILPGLSLTGGERVILTYAQMWIAKGCTVNLYISKQPYIYNRNKDSYIKKIIAQSSLRKRVYNYRNKAKIDQANEEYGHLPFIIVDKFSDETISDGDIVIATAWVTAFTVNSLSSSKGKKWYFIQDYEIWDDKQQGQESYLLPLNKIVISSWINEQLKKDLNIGPFPVVYNGIDLNRFNNDEKRYRDSDHLHVLMLNHTLEKKGVKYGIEAFNSLHKKYPGFKFVMFGMCDNKDIPKYISYYRNPSKNDLVDLYRSSDIYIFPSIEEGWGLTPIEAMACKCAVVGTRTGFVLDLGNNNQNMMVIKKRDPSAIAHAVEDLRDISLRQRISEEGYNTVKELSWDKSSIELIKLFSNRD